MLTLSDIKQNPEVRHYLDRADGVLESIGYTEHGRRHAGVAAERARTVMEALDRSDRLCELAAISAYLHDIGNIVNREAHAQTGATLAHGLLREAGMPIEDIIEVVTAIGHHHETDGAPVSEIAAALILADKSDVHRSRVRNKEMIGLDIHDRVNYAVTHSALRVVGPREAREMFGERENGSGSSPGIDRAEVEIADLDEGETAEEKPTVTLSLEIDTSIAPVMEYFEIFLPRMILSNRAADRLDAVYKLVINETPLL
ncbi:MAG: HD domain-containing protein [Gemmatimonadota bacterium]|nr:HD domain-containing protein [Gemmatimonadota bacterium]